MITAHPTPVVTAPVAELAKPRQYHRQYAREKPSCSFSDTLADELEWLGCRLTACFANSAR